MKKTVVCIILTFIIFCEAMQAYAIGFTTTDVPDELKKQELSQICLKRLNTMSKKDAISYFDVNSKGYVALGFNDNSIAGNLIYVFDPEGNFLYGYSFECNGWFGLEWEEDDLWICFLKENIIFLFDSEGNCLDIKWIVNNRKNDYYWEDSIRAKTRIVDNKTYKITQTSKFFNFLPIPGKQLTITDQNGVTTVFYDAEVNPVTDFAGEFIFVLLLFIAGFTFVAIMGISYFKNYNASHKKNPKNTFAPAFQNKNPFTFLNIIQDQITISVKKQILIGLIPFVGGFSVLILTYLDIFKKLLKKEKIWSFIIGLPVLGCIIYSYVKFCQYLINQNFMDRPYLSILIFSFFASLLMAYSVIIFRYYFYRKK